MDGVRLNQPFGDVVSWDLIPRMAIGIDDADAGIESAVRSQHARRRAVDPNQGRPQQSRDDGAARSTAATCAAPWSSSMAAAAPSGLQLVRRRQSVRRRWLARRFAVGRRGRCSASSAGTQTRRATPRLSVGYADNSLTGNGLQEQRLLDRDYASVYTKPDDTDNRATFVNLTTRRDVTPHADAVSGNVVLPPHPDRTRSTATSTTTRSISRSISPAPPSRRRWPRPATPAFRPAARTPPTRRFRPGAASPTCCCKDEPGEKCNGLLNRSDTSQHNYGSNTVPLKGAT